MPQHERSQMRRAQSGSPVAENGAVELQELQAQRPADHPSTPPSEPAVSGTLTPAPAPSSSRSSSETALPSAHHAEAESQNPELYQNPWEPPDADAMPTFVPEPTLNHAATLRLNGENRAGVDLPEAESVRSVSPPPPTPVAPSRRPTRLARLLLFFGYGRDNKARKELMSLIWTLCIDLSQIIASIALLAYSANHASVFDPSKSEWAACGKPLGVWNALWLPRLALDIGLAYWRWSRERTKRQSSESAHRDAEAQTGVRSSARRGNTTITLEVSTTTPNGRQSSASQATDSEDLYPKLYARLSLFGSMFTLVWFVLAHIFEYSSTNTCRHRSPHLWWLTFGVLCVMYLMILEVFLIALLVFIIGPILLLAWSLFLLCIGRHPLQHPHYLKPDVGKLSKSVVDALPLVIYIPPPPDEFPEKPAADDTDSGFPAASPPAVTLGTTTPTTKTKVPPAPSPPDTRRRFRFLRFRRRRRDIGDVGSTQGGGGAPARAETWEDHWERGAYPFVRLAGNRAACAICLEDFEAPRRVLPLPDEGKAEGQAEGQAVAEGADAGLVLEEGPRLADAGTGVQPLRLLACGHVFHKTCVDPWLVDVSGRCPVCQRPVVSAEEGEQMRRAQRRRRRWWRRRGAEAPRTMDA